MQDMHKWRNIVAMAEQSLTKQIKRNLEVELKFNTLEVYVKSRDNNYWKEA